MRSSQYKVIMSYYPYMPVESDIKTEISIFLFQGAVDESTANTVFRAKVSINLSFFNIFGWHY